MREDPTKWRTARVDFEKKEVRSEKRDSGHDTFKVHWTKKKLREIIKGMAIQRSEAKRKTAV